MNTKDLRKSGDWWYREGGGGACSPIYLCADSLRRYVALPRGLTKLTLVTSKKSPRNGGSFRITRSGRLGAVYTYLMNPFRGYLRDAYTAGDRYVWIEFDA